MPLRVREQYKASPCALFDPTSGSHITPDPGRQYDENEPIVKAAPWYFIAEGQVEDLTPPESVPVPPVEQTTAAPGEKRNIRRRG